MKIFSTLLIVLISFTSIGQTNSENYLKQYDISKGAINELTFINKTQFNNFISTFEDNKGFELPKFFILDNSGKLLKHKLDVRISECGKGDVNELRKKYFKNLPTIDELNNFFNEKLEIPEENDFIVVFIWHEAMDKFNQHTFETYHTWKENDNIKFYFLNLNM
ncbi:hypothetical protein [Flavobacterium sp. CS20]|uniref:hypothetical protein n=1 Tax=Flavobacterium sp. CS20 TaxID=2775246 RepID=UPI001B39EA4F|nr:hypothetical protein [Flavobacterium sp. CS20]QTY27916.1 hypothetical protein IGB25_05275 [Flavobacterium sp. CS20]